MGQKVRPIGFRIGITENWRSRWIANKQNFGRLLVEDRKIREHIKKRYYSAGIPLIEIERRGDEIKVIISAARPGLIIGRKGARVDKLREEIQEICKQRVDLDIKEIATPELSAQVVAESIAEQLEKRAAFRRVMKNAIRVTREAGARGVKLQLSGRLSGSEMARCEATHEGSIPLQTLRAKIDYGFAEAVCTYGKIGVKTWIYKGEYTDEELKHGTNAQANKAPQGTAGPNQG